MTRRRDRLARGLFAAAFLTGAVAVALPVLSTPAGAEGDGSVQRSVVATREFVDENGNETEAARNDITLEVSQTVNLRGRQEIHVAWSGAHPTGGIVSDPNAAEARNQEYPFVLLQCRGIDADAVPEGQSRLTPETCWTQTSFERYVAAESHTPAWRFDAVAPAAERAPVVGAPDPLPAPCATISDPLTARWLPFRAANGTVYYGGPDPGIGCSPLAPETDSAESGAGLPTNTTYGITGTDGRGETDFAVWTSAENGSLGCSAQVSCALVAVPILGLSCDAWGTRLPAGTQQRTKAGTPLSASQLTAANTTCRRTGAYAPGSSQSSVTTDQAVRGGYWWSASNWKNRITVPLEFAATSAVCDAVSKEPPLEVLGSTVLNELSASWRPKFCTTDGLFPFTHIQQAEGLARNLVNLGEIEAALTTAPRTGGYSRPVVQAPVAFGGFAIAFNVDDENRRRRDRLRLNARLVAKLLTSSYPATPMVRDNHPGFADNPLNITLDPEFQALNPGLPRSANLEAAAALQTTSASSDMLWALTSWLKADPEASAFLKGTPDPWGMTVNEAYQEIGLPVDNWPLRDTFVAPQWYQDLNACYAKSPTPFMQLIANPQSNLSTVLLNMQYANSAVQTVCRFDGYDATTLPLRQQGRQVLGYRFVLGLVSVSAAERFNLRTAALQSTSSPAGDDFDPIGRTFVDADEGGLAAAARLLAPDASGRAWQVDASRLSTSAGRGAYPGAMPVYAAVPTRGLDAATATKLGKLLCYAAGDGQQPGAANGQLPAGYLPLTEANGLGSQRDYLLSAAAAVRAQAGAVPALEAPAPAQAEACDFTAPVATPTPTPSGTPSPSATPTDEPADEPTGKPSASPKPTAPVVPPVAVPDAPEPSKGGRSPKPTETPTTEAPVVPTAAEASTFGRLGVPGLLALAVGCAIAGVVVRWVDPISKGLAAAGPTIRRLAQRTPTGRRGGGGS